MKNLYPLTRLLLLALGLCTFTASWAQSDQYLHFDRSNDYIQLDNGSQYIDDATEVSMTGWFYTDELVYGQGMMGFRGSNGFYLIQLDNGTLECRYHNSTGFYEYVGPAFTMLPEVWQHVAWVYDGSEVKLYIDGVERGSVAAAGTFELDNIAFVMGESLLPGLSFKYGGRMDEVSVWSKALSQQDIMDIMENEIDPSSEKLELYYKFNQGLPGGDNTTITTLKSEVGNGERDARLIGFDLTGETSNFNGTLDVGFQAITFGQLSNKLTTDMPFELEASASSNLPVSFSVVSGPATINGNTLTLTGQAGEVKVQASQGGNATFSAAEDIVNTFQVINPQENVPEIDLRHPMATDVKVLSLSPIRLAAISNIAYPELFSVQSVSFEIDGTTIMADDWKNEHYTAWWAPPAYGNYTMTITATNNFGASATRNVSFTVVDQSADETVNAISGEHVYSSRPVAIVEAILPSHLGAYDQIIATMDVTCESNNCDPWDRVAQLEVKGHNGEWVEIIRYITPYGVPCNHSIDLTDFSSLLQGKVTFRITYNTFANGFVYTLDLDYRAGEPTHKYSSVSPLWTRTYDFGNPDNLQPVETRDASYPSNAMTSKLKLISTGHGWGENNTDNAAEFHDDTHHVWVNGQQTFTQRNWMDCNPNPDGCQPQNGTFFHDRAGWCPGAIAPWFDFDMSPYVNQGNVELKYIFDEDYTDFCHPNNPLCQSGVTCPNCDDGFNPHLIVASYLITFADSPLDGSVVLTSVEEALQNEQLAFNIFPNPSKGLFNVRISEVVKNVDVRVTNSIGQLVKQYRDNQASPTLTIDLQGYARGIYFVELLTDKGTGLQRVVIE
ncbi:MAG: LamG-like jellyroll fold domain-containing protein [Bacteroidota bacterium]